MSKNTKLIGYLRESADAIRAGLSIGPNDAARIEQAISALEEEDRKEERIQAVTTVEVHQAWVYQRTPESYLRKLMVDHFGLNNHDPALNDDLWKEGLTPPLCEYEASERIGRHVQR